MKRPYVWGEDEADTYRRAKDLVLSFLTDHIDNGPGWIVTHGRDAYEVHLVVKLVKKPPRNFAPEDEGGRRQACASEFAH